MVTAFRSDQIPILNDDKGRLQGCRLNSGLDIGPSD
jgi:hypothetical protein